MIDPAQIESALQRVNDQTSFVQELLIDTLGWPIDDAAQEIGDIAYEWTEDELRAAGLNEKIVGGKAYQIILPGNPWGIFVMEFANPDVFTTGRGMTGVLRRVLHGLVTKGRGGHSANLPRFTQDNLLFICNHNYERYRFAHFKPAPEGTATAPMTSFGWGPDDLDAVRTICEFNLRALEWPDTTPSTESDWLSTWSPAFDIEKVTKRFYQDYAEVFHHVEEIIRKTKALKGDELRMFTQSLFNRLMFLRFIERKGWLTFPGQTGSRYLAALAAAGGIGKRSLYASRLRPLFFEGLAEEGKQKSDAYGKVPLLNGGLFEKSDLDDKVTDIPDEAFTPILGQGELFYKYNFTVEESTPLDIEVAVDPEMLGKVFEELVTGRHESGSYYTPRPVVAFMCREALKGHLADRTKAPESAIAKLVDDHVVDGLTEAHAKAIVEALDNLKAVDPACGSGAYLLGLLQELIAIRRALQSDKLAADPGFLYDLKLHIISHNLYGVDIDPFATEIAKLRLWLSLAVEADHPVPLPNLDFKIETGDSLLGPDPQQLPGLFLRQVREQADQLVAMKHSHLLARGDQKNELKNAILNEEATIAEALDVDPSLTIVDWRIQFAEVFVQNQGFDVVLANPPYGLLNKRQNQKSGYSISTSSVDSIKRSEEYKPILRGMVNVCALFIRRSFSLLRPTGVFAEIFPLAFACDWSYGPLRAFALRSNQVLRLEAFPERDDPRRRVFASAKMSVCVLLARRGRCDTPQPFALRMHSGPSVDPSNTATEMHPADIQAFDPSCAIPLVSQQDANRLRCIYSNAVRLSELGKCYTGEVDLTLCRKFITSDARKAAMHKGAIIDRYVVRTSMSQGEIEFLDSEAFLQAKGKRKTSGAWHHQDHRIAMQGITGVNERVRLKMTLLEPGVFCANSVNYVRLESSSLTDYLFVLAVLNSDVVNFVFRCFSTNSNVNGYEVDNLPIPKCGTSTKATLADLAAQCLKATGNVRSVHEARINALVEEAFGLGKKV